MLRVLKKSIQPPPTTEMKLLSILPFAFFITASLLGASIGVPQTVPYTSDANTVLLEHFDGSVTGSVAGPLNYTSGRFGQAGNFSTSTGLTWSSNQLPQGTFEFWASLESYTSESFPSVRMGFAYYSGIPAAITFSVAVRDSLPHSPEFALNHAPFAWNDLLPTSPVGLNEWHHYAVTWGDAGMHFYLDGSLVASNSDTGGINPSTQIWGLGSRPGSGYNEGLTGQIDEFRLSNIQREFTPTPEPSTLCFGAVGLFGLLFRRIRK